MINIIGGSGFVGTRLCSLLKSHDLSFMIFDKVLSQKFSDETFVADVRSVDALNLAIADEYAESTIVNLAAEHRDDVTPLSLYHDVNVQGAINICHVARNKKVQRIIFTSTVAVYGFAPMNTDESGEIAPFNEYGKTKFEAETIFKAWQQEEPNKRTLTIIRPTVIFGEQNRGNVYNLLKQIASSNFLMVGNGLNRKSLAYVGNVAAFICFSLSFKPGIHIYNYVDKPDFTMNDLIIWVKGLLGKPEKIRLRLPYSLGLMIGSSFDLLGKVVHRKFPISSIRVKKFCANSVYSSAVNFTGFVPPIPLKEAIEKTIEYEFMQDNQNNQIFFSE